VLTIETILGAAAVTVLFQHKTAAVAMGQTRDVYRRNGGCSSSGARSVGVGE